MTNKTFLEIHSVTHNVKGYHLRKLYETGDDEGMPVHPCELPMASDFSFQETKNDYSDYVVCFLAFANSEGELRAYRPVVKKKFEEEIGNWSILRKGKVIMLDDILDNISDENLIYTQKMLEAIFGFPFTDEVKPAREFCKRYNYVNCDEVVRTFAYAFLK